MPSMRYASMDRPLDMATVARKRPRQDEQSELPPLHAFQAPSLGYAPRAAGLLPTLSQVLRPSMHAFSVLAPPPVSSSVASSSSAMSPPHGAYHGVPRSATSSPSPVESETSMEDDDEAEDKTPWPTANEYFDLLTDESRKAHIPVYDLGVDPRGVPLQPEFIYNEPKSCMYFLKCSQLLGRGSFGFPRKKKATVTTKNAKGAVESVRRCDSTKEFEWRKMSFVTGLPKKQPLVRYITATCYSKTHRSSSEKKKVMRMHAVMLANADGSGENGDYVLVHIRAGGSKRVGVRTNSAPPSSVALLATPVASPARMDTSPSSSSASSSSSSIHSLLSAHNQVMAMPTERPLTPLMYNAYPPTGHSTSPLLKRPRSDRLPSLSAACPRQVPLWLSPPCHEAFHQ